MWASSSIPYISLFCHQQTHTVIFIFFSCTMHYTFQRLFLHCTLHVSLSLSLTDHNQKQALLIRESFFFFEAQKYFFALFNFENGHFHVVSTLINVLKLDVGNNSTVSTMSVSTLK